MNKKTYVLLTATIATILAIGILVVAVPTHVLAGSAKGGNGGYGGAGGAGGTGGNGGKVINSGGSANGGNANGGHGGNANGGDAFCGYNACSN